MMAKIKLFIHILELSMYGEAPIRYPTHLVVNHI